MQWRPTEYEVQISKRLIARVSKERTSRDHWVWQIHRNYDCVVLQSEGTFQNPEEAQKACFVAAKEELGIAVGYGT